MPEEVEYLRLALIMGLIGPDEVVAWADRVIDVLDAPPIQVIEASLAGSRSIDDIVDLLTTIPGDGNSAVAAHRVLGLFVQRFRASGIAMDEVIKMLSAYCEFALIPEDERRAAESLTDALVRLRSTYSDVPDSARSQIEAFATQYSAKG